VLDLRGPLSIPLVEMISTRRQSSCFHQNLTGSEVGRD
jgi:hypothetical protein